MVQGEFTASRAMAEGLSLSKGFWLCIAAHLHDACPVWVLGLLRVSVCAVYDVVKPGPGDIQPRVAPGICLELLVTQRVSRHRILF